MVKKKICCMPVKTACTLAGVLFLILTIITLVFYIYVIMIKFSRGSLINIGFNVILILPALPFFVGIYVQFSELLLPYMICVIFAICNNITWILIAIFVNQGYLDPEQDVFKLEYINHWIFVGLLSFVCFVYAYVLTTIVTYFRYIYRLNAITASDISEKKYYPYTRYGNQYSTIMINRFFYNLIFFSELFLA